MPTYYNQVLGLDLKSSGFFSVGANWLGSCWAAGWAADIAAGWAAHWALATLLAGLCTLVPAGPRAGLRAWAAVAPPKNLGSDKGDSK